MTFSLSASKVFKIGNAFYLYRTDGLFWFRFFGGYGLHYKNTEKHMMLYSERNGYRHRVQIGKYLFRVLKPERK